jgi:hypothetical protein
VDAERLAVRALYAAAAELPLPACAELGRMIRELIVVSSLDHVHELNVFAEGDRRMIGALRTVAEAIGRAPSTSDYVAEYERRRDRGVAGLPAVSTVVKHFAGWDNALAAAGLAPDRPIGRLRRRQTYQRRQVHRYSDERLIECLQACAREIGRIPMVRDYQGWRAAILSGTPGRRRPALSDVPDRRTIHNRYGSWPNGLAAAGLSPDESARVTTTTYTPL